MKSRLEYKDSKDSHKLYQLFTILADKDESLEIKSACKQTEDILDVVY